MTLSIARRQAVKQRAGEAFSGKRRGAHIPFASAELLWKVLTAKRSKLRAFPDRPLSPSSANLRAVPKGSPPVRALVVDDQKDAAESLSRLLQAMGCAATFVCDAAKALDAAAAIDAQIVFLDIGMPDINGYDLAKAFRKHYGEAIRLVAVSGYAGEEHHRMSREAGFDAHVAKPMELKILESMVRTVMAGRR